MAELDAPVPLEETPEAEDPISVLMAIARQQQAQRAQANAGLQQTLGQQRAQAQGLRSLGLLSSFGANPLLRNLQQETGQQSAMLENIAARTEGRMDAGRGIDPLGIARLQQAADKQRQDRELALERLGFQKTTAEAKAEAARQKAVSGTAAAAQKRAEKLAAAEAKIIGDTRKEFEALGPVKEYRMADIAFNRVRNAVAEALNTPGGSPASQMAAVFSVMKTFDPSTGVKEGEYATAEKAGAKVPDWLVRKYNKVVTGEFLTPKQLKDFERAAGTQLAAYRDAYEEQAIRYAGLVPEGAGEKVIGEPVPTRKPEPGATRTPAATAMPPDASGALSLDDVPTPPGPKVQYSPKRNRTRELDASGNVIREYEGRPRG